MRRRIIVLLACIGPCWLSSPSRSAELSGAWKIDTRGGPSPLCGLVQVGNNLSGSCVGPNATGTVIGTVVGPAVRWRWQWTAYGSNAAAAFDFTGILQPDNSMTGVIERREIGLSLNFTATRQSGAAGAPAVSKAQAQPQWTKEMQEDWDRRNTPVMPTPSQEQQQAPLTAKGREIAAADRAFANRSGEDAFDRDLVVRANNLFGSFGTQEQMRQRDAWLTVQQQVRFRNQIEMRKAGYDYTVERRNR